MSDIATVWISVPGHPDYLTTELGLAAYEGRVDFVRECIARGIDWTREELHPLSGAMQGRHWELARELIQAGSPVTQGTYARALDHAPGLLAVLPPRPEWLADIKQQRAVGAFHDAVFDGEPEKARQLLDGHIRQHLNDFSPLIRGLGQMCAIHHAARIANVELLRLLVEAGADVNGLTEKGESALRLAAEAPSLDNAIRGRAVRYLESVGARYVPPVPGFFTRWTLRRGAWLPPSMK